MKKIPEDLAERLYAVGDRFLADGPDVRLDQVAEVVGVPRATLYYYFSGKDDLVSFLMGEKLDRIASCVSKAVSAEGTALERFELAFRESVREFAANPALCLNLMVAMGRMEAMADIMINVDRAVMAPLRELLIEARATGEADVDDVATVVAAIMGGINSAVLSTWALAGEVDGDAVADQLAATALNGLRAR